ncbi:MAG: hypothetical protein Q9207_004283 [Kuettlingeria erythrocarpa]
MTEARKAEILAEAIEPHLRTEEGQVFLAGPARLDKTQTTLAQYSPAAAEHLRDLILLFMWEQIPIEEMQQELRTLLSNSGCLQDPSMLSGIQPFLDMPTDTPEEQVAAKKVLCACFGLVTQKGDAQSQARLQEAIRFQLDVQVSPAITDRVQVPYRKDERIGGQTLQ